MKDLVFKEIEGHKFLIRDESSDGKTIREVIEKNNYEKKYFKIDRGGKWFDFGASIGAFTILAASKGLSVEAYEPDPESFEILKMNVKLNNFENRVNLHNCAVSNTNGSFDFSINSSRRNYWRNSLVKKWRGGQTIKVGVVDINSLELNCSDVKMDIEGSEFCVLESIVKFPRRLVFEWSFDIDPSITRFLKVVDRLKANYNNVKFSKINENFDTWQKSWFPPCKLVYCYNE